MKCAVTYAGPSYPDHHGAQCMLPAEHVDQPSWRQRRHGGDFGGRAMFWYTPEQKAAIDAEMKKAVES